MCIIVFFFFNDTATTEIYTLSLHDALPIYQELFRPPRLPQNGPSGRDPRGDHPARRRLPAGIPTGREVRLQQHRLLPTRKDRKSTRLNSSHANISYAVFCLKKKN